MKKMIAAFGLIAGLMLLSVPAFAGFGGEVYNAATPFKNISTTKALSACTVANSRIIASGSYDRTSFTCVGKGATALGNYSGVLTVWGSNDFTPATSSTAASASGTWAVVHTVTGTATSGVYESATPYKYYAVTYTSNAHVTGAASTVNCVVYQYRSANQ